MGELLLQIGMEEDAATLLDQAALQLATLRRTPARLELLQRLERMRAMPSRRSQSLAIEPQ